MRTAGIYHSILQLGCEQRMNRPQKSAVNRRPLMRILSNSRLAVQVCPSALSRTVRAKRKRFQSSHRWCQGHVWLPLRDRGEPI